MNTQQPESKYNPNARVHVLLSGVMGKEPVVKALFLDPNLKTEKVQVPGYGERIQSIEDIGRKSVREDMKSVWEGREYLGAVGVIKSEGETAEATRVTTTLEGWKTANKLIQEFNYHTSIEDGTKQSWFHNEAVVLPGHEGERPDIIEAFADTNGLRKVNEVYPNREEFEAKMDALAPEMANDIEGFRSKFFPEALSSGGEQKG